MMGMKGPVQHGGHMVHAHVHVHGRVHVLVHVHGHVHVGRRRPGAASSAGAKMETLASIFAPCHEIFFGNDGVEIRAFYKIIYGGGLFFTRVRHTL